MNTSRPCTCGHPYQSHTRRYRYCVACTYDAQIPVIRACNVYEADETPPEETLTMRLPEPCLCGDPLCWQCFPAANPGPDEDTPTVPDACARLLDALDAAETAMPAPGHDQGVRLPAAVQRLLDAGHT